MIQTPDIRDAALRYAAQGLAVLPCHSIVDGRCTCGNLNCASPGKHPHTAHGVKDASSDEAEIRAWWEKWPDSNVGIATGAASGLLVIDVDGPEGEAALAALNLHLPATLETSTGRGRHLYFVAPKGVPTKSFSQHLGVRGDGAYVIAPPSQHASGRHYHFANGLMPIVPPPEALLALLQTDCSQPEVPEAQAAELDTVLPQGMRKRGLLALGGAMRRQGAGLEEIRPALSEANRKRCNPPLPDKDVERIAKRAARYPAGIPNPRKQNATPAPLLKPVDGAALMTDLIADIRKYVVLSEAQAIAIGLWVLHTHAFQAAEGTPYLWVSSPEKQSGKTRLLETLELLVAKPWLTGHVTAAVLVRKIDAQSPTLLLDETDAAFAGDEEYSETLRSVLNTGHRQGGVASCCVGQGANINCKDFSTFCPKALAGIGKLPDTVSDRSIPIKLNRRAPTESVQRFRRRRAEAEAAPIKERAGAWAQKNLATLRNAEPELPEGLSDRQQDSVEPLLAIADLLGDEWEKRARSSLLELFTTGQQEQSRGVELLRDIRAIFDEQGTDRLASETLIGKLVEIETSAWGEWNHGRGVTKIQLARLLKPFGIAPRTIRLQDGSTPKGYHREQFSEAWERYLPCAPALSPVLETPQAPQASIHAGSRAFPESPHEALVADRKSQESPVFIETVADVAGRIPGGEQQPAPLPANWYRPEPLTRGGWRCMCGWVGADVIEWSRHCGVDRCPLLKTTPSPNSPKHTFGKASSGAKRRGRS